MTNNLRLLYPNEIFRLKTQGCHAEDWNRIRVSEHFSSANIHNTGFSGDIVLGHFIEQISYPGGIQRPSGIYNAHLHNCTVGHNCLIRSIGSHIANYRIGENTVIDSVGIVATDGQSSFGNGHWVHVVNEAGGREVPLFDRLSAQLAYLMSMYRHDTALLEQLKRMVAEYVDQIDSSHGTIGSGCWISNCLAIEDVRIGEGARVEGAVRLKNGSIQSAFDASTLVGEGVIAENFIILSGAQVKSGAQVTNSLIGESAKVRQQFSAENSLFFANSEAYHGESCSAFGGPFTVSHHKSTLLLAALYSFYNAGSNTNFSNHMYKLGPVHQGILERGCKTGSGSHLYWPSRIGAFTAILGKHPRQIDTQQLPFSTLVDDHGHSVLLPGLNLFSVGTYRDAMKWPQRDRRTGRNPLDVFHCQVMSPYTVEKMIAGYVFLDDLEAGSSPEDGYFLLDGKDVRIPASQVAKGMKRYDAGIYLYLGNVLIPTFESALQRGQNLQESTESIGTTGSGRWLDWCGLLVPESQIAELLDQLRTGVLASLSQLEQAFQDLFAGYNAFELSWAFQTWLEELGKSPAELNRQDLRTLAERWHEAMQWGNEAIRKDADKEFAAESVIGYGIDSPEQTPQDFLQVRGDPTDHPFYSSLDQRQEELTHRYRHFIELLDRETTF